MKKMKKIIALALAMIMVLAMSVTAFAEPTPSEGTLDGGSITINNTVEGQTYTIYQILKLESYNASANAYIYKATTAWEAWLRTQIDYVSVDDDGYVTWAGEKDEATVAAFAQAALQYAQGMNPPIGNQGTATAQTDDAEIKFENLKLGYYLVDSSLGALCGLNTTNPDATINEKNDKPSIEKKVQEDSLVNSDGNGGWQDVNDAEINQIVKFKTTVHAKKGAENYVVHDKMSAGLTLDPGSIEVAEATVDTDYTVKTVNTDGCTFEIVFKQTYLNRITKDLEKNASADIIITYSATLNENAVIASTGNPNDTKLDYGNNNETAWDTTITYTWEVDVYKYTMNNTTQSPLAGVTFTLSTDDKGENLIKFDEAKNSQDQTIAKTYKVNNDTGTITRFTTDGSGNLFFQGLDAGTYYLIEVETPNGYNKLAGPIQVVIGSSTATSPSTPVTHTVKYYNTTGKDTEGEFTYDNGSTVTDGGKIQVENKSGAVLPETGGIGTTIFYVVGAILMIGAGVLLITRKRISK